MSRSRIIRGIITLTVLWCVGCATPAPAGRVIHQEGEAGKAETFVRLDAVTDEQSFSHPATLPPARLKDILSGITVQWHSGLLSALFSRAPRRAFTDGEAAMLAGHLSRALAEAGPRELAVFYLNVPETGESARVTSGGVYVRDDQLVVMLANYHYVITWSEQATGKSQVSHRTAREKPLQSLPEGDYRLIPGPGQTLLGGNPSATGRFFGKSSRGLVVSLAAAPVQAPPAEAVQPEAATTPQAVAPPPAVPSPLEEKLRTLKKFRDDGLITDEDYEAKKQELLKEF